MSGYNELVSSTKVSSVIRGRKVEMAVEKVRASHLESKAELFGYRVFINGISVAGYWPHVIASDHTLHHALKYLSTYKPASRGLFSSEKRELVAMATTLGCGWILRAVLKNA